MLGSDVVKAGLQTALQVVHGVVTANPLALILVGIMCKGGLVPPSHFPLDIVGI